LHDKQSKRSLMQLGYIKRSFRRNLMRMNSLVWRALPRRWLRARWVVSLWLATLSLLHLASASPIADAGAREALRPVERALESLQVDYRIRTEPLAIQLLLTTRRYTGPDGTGVTVYIQTFTLGQSSSNWFQITAFDIYSLRNCEFPDAARRVLLEAPQKTSTDVQFSYDPDSGTVIARMAVPPIDGGISSQLLREYLGLLVRAIDEIDPVLRRAMDTGLIDWPQYDEGPREPMAILRAADAEGRPLEVGWATWFQDEIFASTLISSDPIWRQFTRLNDEGRERMGRGLASEFTEPATNRAIYEIWMKGSSYVEQHYPPLSIRFFGPPGTKVSATVEVPGFAPAITDSIVIDEMGFREVDLLPDWNMDALLALEAPKQVQIDYSVACGDAVQKGTANLVIQPTSEFELGLELVCIAQAVNEDHPWVRGIISEARNTGIVDTLGASSDIGYNDGVRQIYAVWRAFRDRGLSYVNITSNAGQRKNASQTVRLFHDALQEESANCADGSAAIASVLRKLGFDVHLMYPPGHVLLAVYFERSDGPHWLFLETTVMGDVDPMPEGTSAASNAAELIPESRRGEDWSNFIQACERGLDQARFNPPLISIERLRDQGLRPIPALKGRIGPIPAPMPSAALEAQREARREVSRREREKFEKLISWIPSVAPVPYGSIADARSDAESIETDPSALPRLMAAVEGDSLAARAVRALALIEHRAASVSQAAVDRFSSMHGAGYFVFGVAGHPWDVHTEKDADSGIIRFWITPHDRQFDRNWIELRERDGGWLVTEGSLASPGETIVACAAVYAASQGNLAKLDPILERVRAGIEAGKYRDYESATQDFGRLVETELGGIDASAPAPNTPATAPMSTASPPATPAQTPGTEVQVTDLRDGMGPAARSGDLVTYHYTCSLTDGTMVFDSRPTREARRRRAGGSATPKGLGQGLVGTRKGMHRQLLIPPTLAYGTKGLPPNIPPETPILIDLFIEEVTGR
jgi:FKBP-type peptidyl-prolyl cis-trans isomerase